MHLSQSTFKISNVKLVIYVMHLNLKFQRLLIEELLETKKKEIIIINN